MANVHDINALADLEPNWDSYGAKAIDVRCIVKAREIAQAIHLYDGYSVVPTCTGGVQLERHMDGLDIEILIEVAEGYERDDVK